MKIILFIKNEHLEQFIIDGTIPNGEHAFNHEPQYLQKGAVTLIMVDTHIWRSLKHHNQLK